MHAFNSWKSDELVALELVRFTVYNVEVEN